MRARRRGGALLLLAGTLAAHAPAAADEAIARRLVALDALVQPNERERPPSFRPPSFEPDSCGGWWLDSSYALRSRIEAAIRDASLRFLVDAQLLRDVIHVESAFDVDAVSHKGAMGLMQLMPATARALGVSCPFDPRENVLAGARYLRRLRDRLGSWPRALAGYHAGPGRVRAGRIPAETRHYVERVLARWRPSALAWRDLD